MNKEKIKKLVKEHKTEIALTVGWFAGCTVCGTIMYKAGLRDAIPFKSKEVKESIRHVLTTGNGIYDVAVLINSDSLKIDELGELGKAMVEVCGSPADSTWSRFICISNNLDK